MAYSDNFRVYYEKFRSDPKTAGMKAPAMGAYWLLIMECWDRDNSLPDDIEELALVARMPLKQFQKVWDEQIRRCFRYDGRKRIYWHKRLEQEIESDKRFQKTQSERGKKGATAMHNKRNKLASSSMHKHGTSMLEHGHDSNTTALKQKKQEVGPAREIYIGTILGGIQKELEVSSLSHTSAKQWEGAASWAYDNGFTTEDFMDCYRSLRKNKTYTIQPNYVIDRLPDFAKRNKKLEQLPTTEEKLADDAANRAALRPAPKPTEVRTVQ